MKLNAAPRIHATTELLAGKYADFFKTLDLGVDPAQIEEGLFDTDGKSHASFWLNSDMFHKILEALKSKTRCARCVRKSCQVR